MIDPVRNIAILPASCVFDGFMARLDEIGKVSLGNDGRFSIEGATMVDYRKHYSNVLSGMVQSLSKHVRKIVFIDECLPQNCAFIERNSETERYMHPDNVTRWTVSEDLDIPADEINHMTLTLTRQILRKYRKVIYLANRTLCERYIADGVRFVIGQRLITSGYRYVSGQWKPVSLPPNNYIVRNLPDEPFVERNEALNYLWLKLT